MNETVDKVADKLMASIQKSQNATPEKPTNQASTTSKRSSGKTNTETEPAAKKAIDAILTSTSIESPRKFIGNLRWPD